MKYHCTSCDSTFESTDTDKPRCPKCMSIHNTHPLKNPASPKKKPNGLTAMIALLTCLFAGAAYYLFVHDTSDERSPSATEERPYEARLTEVGIPVDAIHNPLRVTDEITQLARDLSDNKPPLKKALIEASQSIQQFIEDGTISLQRQNEPVARSPLTASEIAAALQKEKKTTLNSYELATFLFSMGMALDRPSLLELVELKAYTGQGIPADPYGTYGRYGVLVDDVIIDPFVDRVTPADDTVFSVLAPNEMMAPYYSHECLNHLARLDTQNALLYNTASLKLHQNHPVFLMIRGKIFLASQAIKEAVTEFERAVKADNWAVTQVGYGQIALLTGTDTTSIEQDLNEILKHYPAYFLARTLLATIHLSKGEQDEAKRYLDQATADYPSTPEIATALVQYYLSENDSENAILNAKKAMRLSQNSFQSMILLAQVYQATARFDEARDTVRKALAHAPSDKWVQQLTDAFGLPSTTSSTDTASSLDADDTDTGLSLDIPDSRELKLNFGKNAPRLSPDGMGDIDSPPSGSNQLQLRLSTEE